MNERTGYTNKGQSSSRGGFLNSSWDEKSKEAQYCTKNEPALDAKATLSSFEQSTQDSQITTTKTSNMNLATAEFQVTREATSGTSSAPKDRRNGLENSIQYTMKSKDRMRIKTSRELENFLSSMDLDVSSKMNEEDLIKRFHATLTKKVSYNLINYTFDQHKCVCAHWVTMITSFREVIDEKESCKAALEKETAQVRAYRWQIESFFREKRALETEVQENKDNYKALSLKYSQNVDSYSRDKKYWEKERAIFDTEISEFKTLIEKFKNEKKNLEHDVLHLKEKLSFSETLRKERETSYDELKNTLLVKDEEIIEVSHQRNNLEAEKQSLSEQVSRLQQELENTKTLISLGQKNLNLYLKKEEEHRDSQIQQYFKELKELKDKIITLEKENDLLRTENLKLKNDIQKMMEEKDSFSITTIKQKLSENQKTIDELKEKNRNFEKSLIKQKNEYDLQIMNLQQTHTLNQVNIAPKIFAEEGKKLESKLRSFIPKLFIKFLTNSRVEESKVNECVMQLMDENLSLLELLQKAESFT